MQLTIIHFLIFRIGHSFKAGDFMALAIPA